MPLWNLNIFRICRDLHLQFVLLVVAASKNHRPWRQRSAHPVNHEKPLGSAKLSLLKVSLEEMNIIKELDCIKPSRRAKCPTAQAKTDIAVACSQRQCVAISAPESIICPLVMLPAWSEKPIHPVLFWLLHFVGSFSTTWRIWKLVYELCACRHMPSFTTYNLGCVRTNASKPDHGKRPSEASAKSIQRLEHLEIWIRLNLQVDLKIQRLPLTSCFCKQTNCVFLYF